MSVPFAHKGWRSLNRPAAWLGALALILAATAAFAPWTISRGALREAVAAQLRSSAGVYVFPRGEAQISLLPRPRVRLADVAMVDPQGALVVETASLTGDIRLLPLLAGRLEVAEVALRSPRITVDVDRAPMSAAGAAVRASETPAATAQAEKADAARLGILSISEGTITLRRNGAAFASANSVNARVDWRTVASPAAVTADLDWRGQKQQFVLWVSQPATLLRGGVSPVTFDVRSLETTLSAAGKANIAVKPRFEGRLQVATTSAPDVIAALGIDLALPAVMNETSLAGDLVATPASAAITNLHLVTGDEIFEGTLALQAIPDARPLLAGTLATASVSLDPYFAGSRRFFASDGRLSTEPMDAAARTGPDFDIRLSAGRLRYGRLQAADAALSLLAKNDRLELSIADASAYGGAIKAKAVVAAGDVAGQSDLQATLLMRDVDWGALDRDLFGQGRFTGKADVTAALQGSGDSLMHMAHSLAGAGRISLRDGDLGGLDVSGTLSRIERRPLAAATDLGIGRTHFQSATLPFDLGNGAATVKGGEILGPDYAMTLVGSIQVPEGQTAMTATVRPTSSAQAGGAGFAFDIAGPWSRPSFVPDVRSWIRKSDAASPLFGAPSAMPTSTESR